MQQVKEFVDDVLTEFGMVIAFVLAFFAVLFVVSVDTIIRSKHKGAMGLVAAGGLLWIATQ